MDLIWSIEERSERWRKERKKKKLNLCFVFGTWVPTCCGLAFALAILLLALRFRRPEKKEEIKRTRRRFRFDRHRYKFFIYKKNMLPVINVAVGKTNRRKPSCIELFGATGPSRYAVCECKHDLHLINKWHLREIHIRSGGYYIFQSESMHSTTASVTDVIRLCLKFSRLG